MYKKKKYLHLIAISIISLGLLMSQFLQTSLLMTAKAAKIDTISKYKGYIYKSNKKYPNAKLPFRIYIPENYDENKAYPLLLHLNGGGENGTDNRLQILSDNLITQLLIEGENPEKYPCIIVAPQCPKEDAWVQNFFGKISRTEDMTIDLINELSNMYNIDKNRLYVTGYSSGASGTWDLLYRYPKMFAAAIPFAGANVPGYAKQIKDVPIWAFHSDGDPIVPVAQTRNMMNALKAAGSTVAKYTEYHANLHHEAWMKAFLEPDFLPWIFSQKNSNEFPPFKPKNSSGNTNSNNNVVIPNTITGDNTFVPDIGSIIDDTGASITPPLAGKSNIGGDTPKNNTSLIITIIIIGIITTIIFVIVLILYKKRIMFDSK